MKVKSALLTKLGQNIRKQREVCGFSQESLAFEAGLDRTYIGGVERGERNLGVLNLCRIAHALKVPPAILLSEVIYVPEEEGGAQ